MNKIRRSFRLNYFDGSYFMDIELHLFQNNNRKWFQFGIDRMPEDKQIQENWFFIHYFGRIVSQCEIHIETWKISCGVL